MSNHKNYSPSTKFHYFHKKNVYFIDISSPSCSHLQSYFYEYLSEKSNCYSFEIKDLILDRDCSQLFFNYLFDIFYFSFSRYFGFGSSLQFSIPFFCITYPLKYLRMVSWAKHLATPKYFFIPEYGSNGLSIWCHRLSFIKINVVTCTCSNSNSINAFMTFLFYTCLIDIAFGDGLVVGQWFVGNVVYTVCNLTFFILKEFPINKKFTRKIL